MTTLPVDGIIPQIHAALVGAPVVIIQAPPGSGKSTRVPLALLQSSWLGDRKVLLLEPRRLAALNLAAWISAGIGEPVGGTVGYTIRFDRKTSPETRLEIVTEGILTRRLQTDPFLEPVGAVIFDEFHERSIHTDTSLAFCLYLQQNFRPDLKIVIMSATLDTRAIAALIPTAKIISCDGTLYPVAVKYLGSLADDPAVAAAGGVRRALQEETGDILVFLPGSGEIRRCLALLQQSCPDGKPLLLPLYGDLSFADQERAIRPGTGRRVVLATNIAETSLTIEGVRVVVDSGLARRSRFDPARALDRLVTERISKASAAQRAGRSGRTEAGVCYRLWSEQQQFALLDYDLPEILTADLTELALTLAIWGVASAAELSFPDAPPVAALEEGRRLLRQLAALDEQNRITPRGRQLAALPLHPRIGTLLLTAAAEGCGGSGADLAAIISERDFLRSPAGREGDSADLLDRVAILQQWRSSPDTLRQRGGIDSSALRSVDRLAAQLRKILALKPALVPPAYDTTALLLATAFPDRIARQREAGGSTYLLANGKGAILVPRAGAANEKMLVAVRIDGGTSGDGRIYSALALDQDQLTRKFPHLLTSRRTASWDPAQRRVTAREELQLGAITLESRVVKAGHEDLRTALLDRLSGSDFRELLLDSAAAAEYRARVEFLHKLLPRDDWPDFSTEALQESAADWLPGLLDSGGRFSGIDLLALYRSLLGRRKEAELDKLAPAAISVPSGSRIRVEYGGAGGPSIAVKLQELFGLGVTPAVADGRFPVTVQLLSPAGRPIQVTRDLQSFWNSGYQLVRKELKGRYPKHPWPDDPWSAVPTRSVKKRAS